MKMGQRKYKLPPEANENLVSSDTRRSINGERKNKERFSDEQVKFLETVFRMTGRIERRKKVQVAMEIGLQPRQVGIWFQNKRARWKSKQMEKDYAALKVCYDTLASKYEALKKENQSLAAQLENLSSQLLQQEEKGKNGIYLAQEINDEESKNMHVNNLYEFVYGGEEEAVHQLLRCDGLDADKFQALPEIRYKLRGADFSDAQIWDF